MNTATAERIEADDKIVAKKQGNIGHIIVNNPEKRNAFSLDMSIAAAQVMEDFLADSAVRVIVLSGTGGKAFISGAGTRLAVNMMSLAADGPTRSTSCPRRSPW